MQSEGAITFFTLICFFAQDGYAYLIPSNPVRVVGESITFECKSPEGFTNNFQSPAMFLWHNDKKLPRLQHSVEGTALKAKHVLANTTTQDAGSWSCVIIDTQKKTTEANFTQNLIVIKGNATPIIGEDSTSVDIRCLDETDKVQPVKVELLVDGENTTSLTLNLKLENGSKIVYCNVCASATTRDNDSCTTIKKLLTVVKFTQCQQGHKPLYNITLCGGTKNRSVVLVNGPEESNLTGVNSSQGCVVYTRANLTDHGSVCIRYDGPSELCKNLGEFGQCKVEEGNISSKGLSVAAKVGIGVSLSVAGILVAGVVIRQIWNKRWRRNGPRQRNEKDKDVQKKDEENVPLQQQQQQQQQVNEDKKTPCGCFNLSKRTSADEKDKDVQKKDEENVPLQQQQQQQQQVNEDKKTPCGCFNLSKRTSADAKDKDVQIKEEENVPLQQQQQQQQQVNEDKKTPCGCFNLSKRTSADEAGVQNSEQQEPQQQANEDKKTPGEEEMHDLT